MARRAGDATIVRVTPTEGSTTAATPAAKYLERNGNEVANASMATVAEWEQTHKVSPAKGLDRSNRTTTIKCLHQASAGDLVVVQSPFQFLKETLPHRCACRFVLQVPV
jgi:hypothetical protein